MPGTPGFDAVHLVLEASIETFGALPTIATALGNVAAAGFLLWAFQRAFLAPRPRDLPAARIARTSRMEYFVGGATLLVLLAAGFYPAALARTDRQCDRRHWQSTSSGMNEIASTGRC
jgi:NADH-quinone oxidoreductase subunit M